ncbi:MAG: GNAT family N-acetyltransferase [Magnetovibrionaceae bacterium]
MASTEITITYLEHLTGPPAPLADVPGARLRYHPQPDPAWYRDRLYNGVGADWVWYERRQLSDAAISALILVPGIEVYTAHFNGALAGYLELNRRDPSDVEVAYFGFFHGFTGKGLGPWMMNCALMTSYGRGAKRVWVHTCTLDHPKAVDFYRGQGFSIYRREEQTVEV